MQKNRSPLIALLFAIICLAFMAIALGKPKISSTRKIKNLEFPAGVAINQIDSDSIQIPTKIKEDLKFEVYNEDLINLKIEAEAARIFSKYAGELVASDLQSKVFKVSAHENNLDSLESIILEKDGSLSLVKEGKERKVLYKFDASYFDNYKKIKDLSNKNYVKVADNNKALKVLDRSNAIFVVFFDKNKKAFPIASGVAAKEVA